MKKRILAYLLCLVLLAGLAAAQAATFSAALTMRLSTRTGPSAAYTEPGTFFSNWQGVTVQVLSKAQTNGTWWVQVEFTSGNKLYRAYTGAKRVAIDITNVPQETVLGTGTLMLSSDVNSYYGPGTRYAPEPGFVPAGASGDVIAYENGFVLLDFFDARLGMKRRAWVNADHMNIQWYSGQPSVAVPQLPTGSHAGRYFYASNDTGITCRVLSVGAAGQYSYIDLYAYGNSYPNIPVYMECAKFGSFATGDVVGSLTFPYDGLFAELLFPKLGVMQTLQLLP